MRTEDFSCIRRLALDIDGTITAHPEFFSKLSHAPHIERCIVVSSRSNLAEVRRQTEQELRDYGIRCDALYLLDSIECAQRACPHAALDWYQKYLWQKVKICLDERIDTVYDDDSKVIRLFEIFSSDIRTLFVGTAID